jgi:hypothetical protein
MDNYELRYVKGHVEIYRHGIFCCSADTEKEAREEIRKQEEKHVPWNVLVV